MIRQLALAACLLIAGYGLAEADPIEVQTPDGQTAWLYDDFTWEYKRPAPSLTNNTVEADSLVYNPGKYLDQEVVVTSSLARVMGSYRLQSDSAQNALIVDVERTRRADQIELDEASKSAGTIGSVKVQIRGKIERKLMIYRLVAFDLLLIKD